MTNRILLLIVLLSFSMGSHGQSFKSLKTLISEIIETKDATVGVSIIAGDSGDLISANGDKRLPMQSVFKYHLAIVVLNQVDKGNLDLLEKFQITPKDLDNDLWSPLRKEYPTGVNLSLAEILNFTLAYSDNVGCDVLFKIIGGPKVVEEFFHQNGVSDIGIKYNELTMQSQWKYQYENWTTANAANLALEIFYENSRRILSPESHSFLWNTMKNSKTGAKTIKANLPKGTMVAHKTGSSGKNKAGLTGAQNDIGIIFLPDGSHFYLSVLVSDSKETQDVNEKIIADIAKTTWDYFENN